MTRLLPVFKRRILHMLCLTAILCLSPGCRPEPAVRQGGAVLKDDLGREVRLDRVPQRIVSLAPGMTEMLYALGLDRRVVGRTDFCDYPSQARSVRSVGGYTNPNLEVISLLKPDLVLIMHGTPKAEIARMEGLGLTVAAFNPGNLQQLYGTLEKLGRMTGTSGRAAELVASFRERSEAVRRALPAGHSPSVLYVIWDQPLFTAGSGTFINDILEEAGGRNVAAGMRGFPQLSREAVLREDPEIIIYSDKVDFAGRLRREKVWQGLKAVRRGEVYPIDEDIVSRPGPRLLDGLEKTSLLLRGRGK